MNIIAIVQARTQSKRLPRKVLKPLGKSSVIGFLLSRLRNAKTVSMIVVATSTKAADNELAQHVQELGFPVYRGDEEDVLCRFRNAAEFYEADAVVRVTGDCPLIDPEIVDKVVTSFINCNCDYVSNVSPPTFPDGLDVEVFSYSALEQAEKNAKTKSEREHVTVFIRDSGKFVLTNITNNTDNSDIRVTLDDSTDYETISGIVEYFSDEICFGHAEVVEYFRRFPVKESRAYGRNEGSNMNSGQKIWRRAKAVIPGGNMLLSKRPEMFLPGKWPAYFSRTSGCTVWDLDDCSYTDISLMGVGTNILGYSHPEVDDAVREVIANGNMSTLNAAEEVYLAERLIDMHQFADMAKFCRTGGEANAVAIRIARAASGKDAVAICGYHGWHDWYLATNLASEDGLRDHLLPGLSSIGVPKGLEGTVLPFEYNNIDQLQSIVSENSVAAIKMEVFRNSEPRADFLQKVRELSSKHNIVLIFDECTSGFRESFGGLHKKYDVEPDLAIFGKTLGNGYAISAVIGSRSVMDIANETFISSTFWTERIGLAAALKTLEIMERERTWLAVTEIGAKIREKWLALAKAHSLNLSISGLPALSSFRIESPDMDKYKTLITQEMLKRGFLCSTTVYACTAHNNRVVEDYVANLDKIFYLIRLCEKGDLDINEILEGPVCHSGFKRLN